MYAYFKIPEKYFQLIFQNCYSIYILLWMNYSNYFHILSLWEIIIVFTLAKWLRSAWIQGWMCFYIGKYWVLNHDPQKGMYWSQTLVLGVWTHLKTEPLKKLLVKLSPIWVRGGLNPIWLVALDVKIIESHWEQSDKGNQQNTGEEGKYIVMCISISQKSQKLQMLPACKPNDTDLWIKQSLTSEIMSP